jgi:hypothetical protein
MSSCSLFENHFQAWLYVSVLEFFLFCNAVHAQALISWMCEDLGGLGENSITLNINLIGYAYT